MSSSLPFFHEREIMMNALRIRAKAYCEHFGKDTVSVPGIQIPCSNRLRRVSAG